MTARFRTLRILAPALALGVASAALVACSDGLEMDNDSLPTPMVAQGDPAAACGSPAGTATLVLSDIGTGIVENAPNRPPVSLVRLVGSSTGLDPAAHAIWLFLIPSGTDCPAYEQISVVPAADGNFTGDLELPDGVTAVRAVAVAGPIGTTVSCGSTDACVSVAGYLASSNTLEIRPGL